MACKRLLAERYNKNTIAGTSLIKRTKLERPLLTSANGTMQSLIASAQKTVMQKYIFFIADQAETYVNFACARVRLDFV